MNKPMTSHIDSKQIHVFDNGVKVYMRHLLTEQLERYAKINLHEPEEEALFIKLIEEIDTENGVFLNIGSAIGYYVILARKLHPNLEIHAFEPLPEHLSYMQANLDLNGITMDHIIVHETAVSSRDGSAPFSQRDYGSSLIHEKYLRLPNPPAHLQSEVKVTMLDTFQESLDKPIDLVQMDVQGFEVDVLAGSVRTLAKRLVKTWLVGTHDKRIHEECRKLLASFGYRIIYDDMDTKFQFDGILLATIN